MNWRTALLALSMSLLLPLGATTQQTTRPEKIAGAPDAGAERSHKGQMYEDIEIMRRLFNSKLQSYAAQNNAAYFLSTHAPQNSAPFLLWQNTACTNCHGNAHNAWLDFSGVSGKQQWLNPYVTLDNSLTNLVPNKNLYYGTSHFLAGHNLWTTAASAPSPLAEGTYLKGQGVVFTLTLAPPDRDPRPEPPKPAPKPPSEWERIRKEVRQEKAPAEETAKPAKTPTLSEVILKLLAENGRHFAQLGENESLTVAITFRAPQAPSTVGTGATLIDVDSDGRPDLYIANMVDSGTVPPQPPPQKDKNQSKPAADDANHKRVKDLTLLGELHLKQSKTDEAIKALRQALELKPEGPEAVAVNRLLAQALLAAQKDEEAGQAVQKAVEWLKKQQTKPAPKTESTGTPPPAPLPSKLIISAPKKLLDAVASGKMSFEEFTKAASVEYVTFPAEKK